MDRLDAIFKSPKNPEAKIWRYMDFSKFVWLLDSASLYFPRADKLKDPFEGAVPELNYEAVLEQFSKADGEVSAKHLVDDISRSMSILRTMIFINSWHMNEAESMAMWKIYSKGQKAIAITSTFQKLRDCLPQSIHIGLVKYINYESEGIPHSGFINMFEYYTHKKDVYKYENEIRAVVTGEFPREALDTHDDPSQIIATMKEGLAFPINLNKLLSAIYVSPNSKNWYLELVRNVSKKYKLKAPIIHSGIDSSPKFGI